MNTMRRTTTGVPGLDEILCGGLVSNRSYLLAGAAGSGKTLLSLQYLLEGVRLGERCLFLSLAEPCKEITRNAEHLGWDLIGIDMVDLSPNGGEVTKDTEQYHVFSPSEVEQDSVLKQIYQVIDNTRPKRVVIDSLTQLRFLAADEFQFRKNLLNLVTYLGATSTALLAFEPTEMDRDAAYGLAVDGIIRLRRDVDETVGIGLRSVRIEKLRGSDFLDGLHSLRLSATGMRIFPHRIEEAGGELAGEHLVKTGLTRLDELLGGGIESGTTTLISGPTGAGKSVLGTSLLISKARQGDHVVLFTFEEPSSFILRRCRNIGTPIEDLVASETLTVMRINPMKVLPDEFLSLVRHEVEERQCTMVMIDSLRGYSLAMAEFGTAVAHIHNLVAYLSRHHVTALLISEVENIAGGTLMATDLGVSHYADNVILLRYAEYAGQIIKVINCLKKRLGTFQPELREYSITPKGITLGEKLSHLHGVLTGTPADRT